MFQPPAPTRFRGFAGEEIGVSRPRRPNWDPYTPNIHSKLALKGGIIMVKPSREGTSA